MEGFKVAHEVARLLVVVLYTVGVNATGTRASACEMRDATTARAPAVAGHDVSSAGASIRRPATTVSDVCRSTVTDLGDQRLSETHLSASVCAL